MISVKRTDPPKELTEAVVKALTDEFKCNNKKAVWNKPYIREGLASMSNNKCIYCEEIVNEGCREMHVDHYHDKKTYPDEVVIWNNLLPSCSYCNKKKSSHDTYREPIINPTNTNPKDIFYMSKYRYRSRDINPKSLGRTSIDVLGLNDTEEKVTLRYEIGVVLESKFDELYEDAIELGDDILVNTRKRNRIINGCTNCLKMCTRTSRFGACMATVLHESEDYIALRDVLIKYGLWTQDMENLHLESTQICLIK